MFKNIIDSIIGYQSQKIEANKEFVYLEEILDNEELLRDIKNYFSAEVDWWLYEDRITRESSKNFDFSDKFITDLFVEIDGHLKSRARFTQSDIRKLLNSAVKTRFNFLIRPRITLSWFIFRGEPTKSLEEIILKLNYFSDYSYLLNPLTEDFQSLYRNSSNKLFSRLEFEKAVKLIDDSHFYTISPNEFIDTLDPIFGLFNPSDTDATNTKLPLDALLIFLDDKGLIPVLKGFQLYSKENNIDEFTKINLLEILNDLIKHFEDNPSYKKFQDEQEFIEYPIFEEDLSEEIDISKEDLIENIEENEFQSNEESSDLDTGNENLESLDDLTINEFESIDSSDNQSADFDIDFNDELLNSDNEVENINLDDIIINSEENDFGSVVTEGEEQTEEFEFDSSSEYLELDKEIDDAEIEDSIINSEEEVLESIDEFNSLIENDSDYQLSDEDFNNLQNNDLTEELPTLDKIDTSDNEFENIETENQNEIDLNEFDNIISDFENNDNNISIEELSVNDQIQNEIENEDVLDQFTSINEPFESAEFDITNLENDLVFEEEISPSIEESTEYSEEILIESNEVSLEANIDEIINSSESVFMQNDNFHDLTENISDNDLASENNFNQTFIDSPFDTRNENSLIDNEELELLLHIPTEEAQKDDVTKVEELLESLSSEKIIPDDDSELDNYVFENNFSELSNEKSFIHLDNGLSTDLLNNEFHIEQQDANINYEINYFDKKQIDLNDSNYFKNSDAHKEEIEIPIEKNLSIRDFIDGIQIENFVFNMFLLDDAAYNSTLDEIDKCPSYDDAISIVENYLLVNFIDPDSDVKKDFFDCIKRRFE